MPKTVKLTNLIETDVTWNPHYVEKAITAAQAKWSRVETVRNIYLETVKKGNDANKAAIIIEEALGIKRTSVYYYLQAYQREVKRHLKNRGL